MNESLRLTSETNSTSAEEDYEGYRQKIKQLETELQLERDELKRIQTETMTQIGRLEDNQRSLVCTVSLVDYI